jgi:hypothetical protein
MLERARQGAADEAPAPEVSRRFERVDAPDVDAPGVDAPDLARSAPTGPHVRDGVVDRFAPPALPLQELDHEAEETERPQVRCIACGAENGKFGAACASCGASLRGRAVSRINRRLWEEERAQRRVDRQARRAENAAEVDALAAERRARALATVDAAFDRFVAEEHARRSQRGIDRVAAALDRGPLAGATPGARRAAIVVVAAATLGALSWLPGTGARMLQLGLTVLFLSLWLRR